LLDAVAAKVGAHRLAVLDPLGAVASELVAHFLIAHWLIAEGLAVVLLEAVAAQLLALDRPVLLALDSSAAFNIALLVALRRHHAGLPRLTTLDLS